MRSISTADRPADVRVGVRRAAFRSALRDGDDLAAARAASRLRVHRDALAVGELAEARAARARIGRAIREARWRKRLTGPAIVTRVVEAQPVPRRLPVQTISNGVALVAMVALLVAILIPRETPDDPAPAATPPDVAVTVHLVETVSGRGRTTIAVALQAAPSPSPTPEATPAPTPSAEPTAAPTVAPRRSAPVAAASATPGGAPGGVPGGVPGGTPGGVPGGQPGGTGSATPRPTQRAPLFATAAPTGWTRITFVLSNGITGVPLTDVCVNIATVSCEISQRYTNVYGKWWLDLPPEAATEYSLVFELDRFAPAAYHLTVRHGRSLEIPIKLYQVR